MKNYLLILFVFAGYLGFAQPNTSAPAPPARDAADVVSIYGEAYTNITDVNYNPNWGQSGTVNTDFDPGDGNLAMAYTNFNYQGTDFSANPQNASAMEFIHIDIWTSTATVVQFTPIDNSGMGPSEVLVDVPLVNNGWSSVDIPKSDFTDMSWNSVFQLKFDAQAGVTPCDIYLDNVYFWKTGVDSTQDATLSDLQVDGAAIQGFNASAFTYMYGVPGGGSVPEITAVTTSNPNATATINQATSVPGDATVDVTAEDGMTMATYTISYFFNSPEAAAPTPTRSESAVISLFSEPYVDVAVDTWRTSWSEAVYEEVMVAGDAVKRYTSLGFVGIETTMPSVDASAMTHLHMDVWTPNITTLNVKLVDFLGDGFGGTNGDTEANLNVNLTAGEWNTVEVALADLFAAGMTSVADVNQYVFTSTPFGAGIAFIDNVYFYDENSSVSNTSRQTSKILVYPNPVRQGETIYFDEEVKEVQVFDVSGRLILNADQPIISSGDLSKGQYIIQMLLDSGERVNNTINVQ